MRINFQQDKETLMVDSPRSYRNVNSCANCNFSEIKCCRLTDGGFKFYCSFGTERGYLEPTEKYLNRLPVVSSRCICDEWE